MSQTLPPSPSNADTATFDAAALEGRFIGRRCDACQRHHWYPRPFCPFCGGATSWVDLSGQGVVYSFSPMRRVPEPYVIAYVTLAEGPTMLTHIVDADADLIAIGQAVKVTFKDSEGGRQIPCFTPV